MTRRNKLIILATYLLVIATALPLYLLKRNRDDRRLKADISATNQELANLQAAAREFETLRRLFPAEAQTASFVEDLYAAARQSKLAAHDASSENTVSRAPGRASGQPDALSSYRFRIHVEGDYRSIAEYIRRVQNIERLKRITEIRLVPGKTGISGSLVMELYSLKGQNAR